VSTPRSASQVRAFPASLDVLAELRTASCYLHGETDLHPREYTKAQRQFLHAAIFPALQDVFPKEFLHAKFKKNPHRRQRPQTLGKHLAHLVETILNDCLTKPQTAKKALTQWELLVQERHYTGNKCLTQRQARRQLSFQQTSRMRATTDFSAILDALDDVGADDFTVIGLTAKERKAKTLKELASSLAKRATSDSTPWWETTDVASDSSIIESDPQEPMDPEEEEEEDVFYDAQPEEHNQQRSW